MAISAYMSPFAVRSKLLLTTSACLCSTIALEMVEQIYQSSIVPKEVQKEPPLKRSSYKAVARKEQPLFDINPRITREFLLRAQSEPDGHVTFQLPDEQFTQWKEEEELALKVDQPPEERPTSFAQALLRKLNISDGGDGTIGSKGVSVSMFVLD